MRRSFIALVLLLGSLYMAAQQQNFPGASISQSGGGTTNIVPKFTSATGIGNSSISDNGTTVSTTEAIVAPTIGPSATQQHTLPAVASDTIALLTATQTFLSKSTGAGPLTGTVASGAAVMGTALIGSGACAAVVTVGAPGVLTSDVSTTGFNGDPTAVIGYGVSATGAVLTIYSYPTTNNVNFKVCNSTAAAITPSALTLNWKVVR